MKKEVVAHEDPKSPISEVFRTLRTNIQFINTDKKIKTLLVTSTYPGEGKSWVASNLAVTFAQAGKKTVLIDADMRKGRQYEIFDVVSKPGLSNYLSKVGLEENKDKTKGILACLQKTEIKNLYVMPAGSIPPNPSELLVSSKMKKLLEKLKKVCDMIIIDGTPCELVTDAVVLSRIVDSTVIVTAHKKTKKDALKRAIRNIQNVGGKITGIVINKMPISSKQYEQKYYYYGEQNDRAKEDDKNIQINKKKEEFKRSEIREVKKPELKKETQETTQTKLKKETQEAIIKKSKTEDILKQMNEYLEKENAKKGEEND